MNSCVYVCFYDLRTASTHSLKWVIFSFDYIPLLGRVHFPRWMYSSAFLREKSSNQCVSVFYIEVQEFKVIIVFIIFLTDQWIHPIVEFTFKWFMYDIYSYFTASDQLCRPYNHNKNIVVYLDCSWTVVAQIWLDFPTKDWVISTA